MDRNWESVNESDVQKFTASPRFIHKSACGCGIPIFTFRKPGESVEGRLRTCENHDRADRAACAHLHYLTQTGQDAALAIRLSKMLWYTINGETNTKAHLWGEYVRITYIGARATRFGHAQKIYRVEVDRGTITEKFEGVNSHGAKSRPPRKARPIRRPAGVGTHQK